MARAFRSRSRGAAPSRQNVWIGVDITQFAVAADTDVLFGTLNAAALALRPFTVMRTHLLVSWATDQGAAAENTKGAVGAIVVQADATTIGITAVPKPVSGTDAPWFVWQPVITSTLFLSSIGFYSKFDQQYEVDSKAMRKVGANEQIAFVAENSGGSAGADCIVEGRMLVKLH